MKRRWKDLIIIWLWALWIVWTIYAITNISPTWLAVLMITFAFLSTFFITFSLIITDDFWDE
jgi:hypothetical protein